MQLAPGEGPVCDFCFVETTPQPNCDCADDCPCHRFWQDSDDDPEDILAYGVGEAADGATGYGQH